MVKCREYGAFGKYGRSFHECSLNIDYHLIYYPAQSSTEIAQENTSMYKFLLISNRFCSSLYALSTMSALPSYGTIVPRSLTPRSLSTENKINVIIGVLAIVVATISAMIAWSTWKLSRRRRRLLHDGKSNPVILLPKENKINVVSLTWNRY
ncbi:hypothetical protein ONS96_012181 [Cadophora gregata f. sp. sojae]|nr:hypothetical protein ONS96_012181 [Cadophora gregata f. sp. sojae]